MDAMITYGTKKEDLKKSTDNELVSALLTIDGCGEKLKKEVLITLLRRHFNSDLIKIIESK